MHQFQQYSLRCDKVLFDKCFCLTGHTGLSICTWWISTSSSPWLSTSILSAHDPVLVRSCLFQIFSKYDGTLFVITKTYYPFRHPERASRPSFSDLASLLSQPDSELLAWSDEDRNCHSLASVLGAPLEAGNHLYPLLQRTYNL